MATRSRRRVLGIVAGVLAVVGFGILAVAGMAVAGLGDVRPQPFTAPGSTTVEANAGTKLTVFAQTAGQAPGGAATTGELGACRAVGPDGREAVVRPVRGRVTVDVMGDAYVGVHVVEPTADGSHEIRCEAPAPTGAAVGSFAGAFGSIAAVIGGFLAGGLVLVAALVVGIIAVVVRAQPPAPGEQRH